MAEPDAVRAAGGVVWRRGRRGVEVVLVHRPKYDDWSLPKGKLDPGEPPVAGAVREIAEETGFRAVPGRRLGTSAYRVLDRGRPAEKTVQWWAMEAVEGAFVPTGEVDTLQWVPPSQALARVSAGYDCAPLLEFCTAPPETTTVLVVRHGSAGERRTWDGPDDERPLDARGGLQAHALADLLALYAPMRVLSAPPLRCRDTAAPLARRLRVGVEVEEAAAEERAGGDLVALLRVLGRGEQATAVVSQGGVIPGALRSLADEDGVQIGEPVAAKGSVWVLSFRSGRLVDADHLPPPA